MKTLNEENGKKFVYILLVFRNHPCPYLTGNVHVYTNTYTVVVPKENAFSYYVNLLLNVYKETYFILNKLPLSFRSILFYFYL